MNIVKCSYCNQPCINNETHICKEGVHLPYERSVFHYDFQIPSQEHGNVQELSSLSSELSHRTVLFSSDITNVCGEFNREVSVNQDQSTLYTSLADMNDMSTQKVPSFQSSFNKCELQNLNREMSLARSYEGFQIYNFNEEPSPIYPQYFSTNRDDITLNGFERTNDCIESMEAASNIQLDDFLEKRSDIHQQEQLPRSNSFAIQLEKEIETAHNICVSLSGDTSENPLDYCFKVEGPTNSVLNKPICPECENGLGFKSKLNYRSLLLYYCTTFICDICQKEFMHPSPLKNSTLHSTQNDCLADAGPPGSEPSLRDISQKNFTEESNLKRHKHTHERNSSSDNALAIANSLCSVNSDYTCPECWKPFRYQSHLSRHFVKHLRGKKFFCNICDRGFTLKIHLKRHEILHTREKSFK